MSPKIYFQSKNYRWPKKDQQIIWVFENVSSDYTSLISVEIYVDYNIVSAHLGQYHIDHVVWLIRAGHCEALVYFRIFEGP